MSKTFWFLIVLVLCSAGYFWWWTTKIPVTAQWNDERKELEANLYKRTIIDFDDCVRKNGYSLETIRENEGWVNCKLRNVDGVKFVGVYMKYKSVEDLKEYMLKTYPPIQ